MRAKNFAARQSGRSADKDGRRTPPANTRSVTALACSRSSPAAAAPGLHQACGTPATVAWSASPSSARTKTGRPAARQFSIRRRGSAPLPATMPRGPSAAIRSLPLADRARRIGADERYDVIDRSDAAVALGTPLAPVGERALGRAQELVRSAQGLDRFSAEA